MRTFFKLIDKLTYTIIQLKEVRTSPTCLGVRAFQGCQGVWPYMRVVRVPLYEVPRPEIAFVYYIL